MTACACVLKKFSLTEDTPLHEISPLYNANTWQTDTCSHLLYRPHRHEETDL